MRPRFIQTVLLFAAFMMVASLAQAQLIATNNLGAFDPSGPFDLNGKFTSLGESGGVPGPTPTGCDLYGFRAQLDSLNSVNLGMQVSSNLRFPALSFQGNPLIISQSGATGAGGTGDAGCGDIIAAYFDSFGFPGANNFVYAIYGSGFASNGLWVASDRKTKREIQPIADAADILTQLNGVSYEYKTDEFPEKNFKEGRQYGFIAQEVAEILPEATQLVPSLNGEADDIIAMNYDMIIPVLTEVVKKQMKVIEEMQTRLAQLEERSDKDDSKAALDPNTSSNVSLSQNRPNPFKGMTTIEYSIPESMTNARLVVYGANGS
ncbi:MAG: tail fiber domain-containing protein, partial [Bacteroidota bacterium]